MKYRVLLCVFSLMIMGTSRASAVGEAGAQSLTISPGARADGLGESYVAISDDATAAWWNAGGLAFLKERNLAFMHSQLVPDLASDVYYEYLGYSQELPGTGTLGLSLIYLTYGTSIATDPTGLRLGEFKSWEGSLAGSFATKIGDNLGVGVSMKFIHIDFAPGNLTPEKQNGAASGFAVDAGALWKSPSRKLNLGMSVVNAGPRIAFIDREQSDPLPFTARVGAAYVAVSDELTRLMVTADAEQSLVWLIDGAVNRRRSEVWHTGVEYRYAGLLSGRVGYIYDKDGDIKNATYGLGFIYKDRLSFDYANVPQATTLERVHRWSVYFKF